MRVLVVDDNHDAADTLAAMLRLDGHEVTAAYGGEQAISTALDTIPDLVLLDINMPGINGFEVARRLRAEPRARDCRLVAVTGYGHAAYVREAADAGIQHHLIKPVTRDQLHALLTTLSESRATAG
jgi:CheY-like chemotaxis protein